jgi:hypothetical protein
LAKSESELDANEHYIASRYAHPPPRRGPQGVDVELTQAANDSSRSLLDACEIRRLTGGTMRIARGIQTLARARLDGMYDGGQGFD